MIEMNQKAYTGHYGPSPRLNIGITPEEYSVPHQKVTKIKWRFKPKSIWPLISWGFILFILLRIIVFPLIEGIFNYGSTIKELNALKTEYQKKNHQLAAMTKIRDYMMTPSYIEERGHQIGMVKENETQMVVVDSAKDDDLSKLISKRKRSVEIGD